jgi:hypothetical protein
MITSPENFRKISLKTTDFLRVHFYYIAKSGSANRIKKMSSQNQQILNFSKKGQTLHVFYFYVLWNLG